MFVVLTIALAGALSADAWAAPGDHVRVGDLSVAPRIEAGFTYRSNVYRQEVDPNGGGMLSLAPGVDLTLNSDHHDFKLGGTWELRKWIAVEQDADDALSASSLDRVDNFSVDLGAGLFKDRPVGFEIDNHLSLRSTTTDLDYADAPFTVQFREEFEGGLRMTPSSALEIKARGLASYDDYRVPVFNGEGFESYNARTAYGPKLSSRYLFLPRTAWTLGADVVWFDWRDNAPSLGDTGGTTTSAAAVLEKPDSTQIKFRTGIAGQVTEKVSVDLNAGYGVSSFKDAAAPPVGGLDGLLLGAQIRYALTEKNTVSLGYRRDFQDSWVANFIRYDYLYAQYAGRVGDFRPSVSYGVRFEEYQSSAAPRNDIVNRLGVGGDYVLTDWASLGAGLAWTQRASSVTERSYDDVEVNLKARFVY